MYSNVANYLNLNVWMFLIVYGIKWKGIRCISRVCWIV